MVHLDKAKSMRKCGKCKEKKEITAFYRNIDKTQSYCIECSRAIRKANYVNHDEWVTLFCGEGNWWGCYFN